MSYACGGGKLGINVYFEEGIYYINCLDSENLGFQL